MQFQYKAKREDGSEISGVKEASDRFALARELRSQSLTVISAEELSASRKRFLSTQFRLLGRVKIKDLIIFSGSLSAMIGAGLSLSRALEVLERQTGNKRFKEIIAKLVDQVGKGSTLSEAMKEYPDVFPTVLMAMVGAGEESGKLAEAFDLVRQQLAKSYDLQRKVRGAMIYPAIIIGVIIIIGILMMIYLVPNLSSLFKELNVELPLSTRIVIGVSDFLSQYTLIFVAVVLATIIAVVKFLRTNTGHRISSRIFLRLPVIKTIVQNLNAALTMRTISSLISSGISMIEALAITERVIQNYYFKQVLASAGSSIEKGATLSSIFKNREDLFPILVGEMTEVGEETGNLSGMLLKGGVFFEEEVDQATKNLSTIIEPVLMIIIGIAVGLFAVSMIGPMYSLTDAL